MLTEEQKAIWWLDDSNYEKHAYTKHWLGQNSKYAQEIEDGAEILFKRGDSFTIKQTDNVFQVGGMFSTDDRDRDDEVIVAGAFDKHLDEFRQNPILLLNHDWSGLPIGSVPDIKSLANGLGGTGEIYTDKDLPTARAAAALVRHGVLKNYSIGFRVMARDKEDPRTITEAKLYEVSIVNIPANPNARLEQKSWPVEWDGSEPELVTKSLDDLTQTILKRHNPSSAGDKTKGANAMSDLPITQIEKAAEQWLGKAGINDTLEKVQDDLKSLAEAQDKLKGLDKVWDKKLDDLKAGLISDGDFKTFVDTINGDVKALQDTVTKGNMGGHVVKARYNFKDWRHITDFAEFDDDGKALEGNRLKAFRLFEAPVNYEEDEYGKLLLLARNLNDAVIYADAAFRGKAGYRGPESLKSYQHLRSVVEQLDRMTGDDFAKAMYSTGSGVGDEWVPTVMSAQMEDLYRLTPSLDSYMRVWEMPSQPATYPIKSGVATAYIASEASTDNPSELKKSEFATSNVTFTAKEFAVATAFSRIVTEDSLIPIIPEIREEQVIALKYGFENALCNGDITATHRDADAEAEASDSVQRAFTGLRYLAHDDSKTFDTQSTTANVGDATAAFHEKDCRYCRKLCGAAGVRPNEGMYVAGISVYFNMLNFATVTSASTFGKPSTWVTGTLPSLDGSPIYISETMKETLDSSGNEDSSTHKDVLYFNKLGVMIGNRRGITVDYEFNVRTQQYCFVATMRRDFQKMWPATKYPVGLGYNIE